MTTQEAAIADQILKSIETEGSTQMGDRRGLCISHYKTFLEATLVSRQIAAIDSAPVVPPAVQGQPAPAIEASSTPKTSSSSSSATVADESTARKPGTIVHNPPTTHQIVVEPPVASAPASPTVQPVPTPIAEPAPIVASAAPVPAIAPVAVGQS